MITDDGYEIVRRQATCSCAKYGPPWKDCPICKGTGVFTYEEAKRVYSDKLIEVWRPKHG
jgi:hypothetical protein